MKEIHVPRGTEPPAGVTKVGGYTVGTDGLKPVGTNDEPLFKATGLNPPVMPTPFGMNAWWTTLAECVVLNGWDKNVPAAALFNVNVCGRTVPSTLLLFNGCDITFPGAPFNVNVCGKPVSVAEFTPNGWEKPYWGTLSVDHAAASDCWLLAGALSTVRCWACHHKRFSHTLYITLDTSHW